MKGDDTMEGMLDRELFAVEFGVLLLVIRKDLMV